MICQLKQEIVFMPSTPTTALDATLVNNLMSAVTEVLTTMAHTHTVLKEIQPHMNYQHMGDLSSVIGIAGENGEGMLTLSFPESLAKLIVARLLGMSANDISKDDMVDGIGEFINMVSGRVKTSLSNSSGNVYRLSLPSIIMGGGHEILGRPKNAPYLSLFFEAEGEVFSLQVTFRNF
jgi:CheY-specific phosphatase CheX